LTISSAYLRPRCATGFSAFRTQIDDPVGRANDFGVVLDHQQRSAVVDQPFEDRQELRDVVEVQTGCRFVAMKSVPSFVA